MIILNKRDQERLAMGAIIGYTELWPAENKDLALRFVLHVAYLLSVDPIRIISVSLLDKLCMFQKFKIPNQEIYLQGIAIAQKHGIILQDLHVEFMKDQARAGDARREQLKMRR